MLKSITCSVALILVGVAMLPAAAAASATPASILVLDADGRILGADEVAALVDVATLEAAIAAELGGPVDVEILEALPPELGVWDPAELVADATSATQAQAVLGLVLGVVFTVILIVMVVLLIVIFTGIPLAGQIAIILTDAVAALCQNASQSCPLQ